MRGHMHDVPEYADLFLLIENIHLNKMVLVTNLTHLAIICFAGSTLKPRGLNFGVVHVVKNVYIAKIYSHMLSQPINTLNINCSFLRLKLTKTRKFPIWVIKYNLYSVNYTVWGSVQCMISLFNWEFIITLQLTKSNPEENSFRDQS